MKKASVKRIVLCSLLALPLGLFAPSALLAPVGLVFLYAYAGLIPAGVMYVVMITVMASLFDMSGIAFLLFVITVPAACTVIAMEKRLPFFKQLRISLLAFGVCVIGYVVLSTLIMEKSIVTALLDGASGYLENYGDQEAELLLTMLGSPGGEDLSAKTRVAEYFTLLADAINAMLPYYMIVYASVNAILSAHMLNRIRKKRGDEQADYVPLMNWHLPVNTVIGIAFTLLVSWILFQAGVRNADYAYSTVLAGTMIACNVQAGSSLMRRLPAGGLSPRFSAVIAGFAMLLATQYMFAYGAVSALFGSFGACTLLMKDYKQKHGNGDENR